MPSGARTAHTVEVTAESLQEDLDRLKTRKQALEREPAAVVAHVDSVQRALGALQVLMRGPADAGAGGQKKYGRLTERILDCFTTVGGAGVRARDVAAALGRDTGSGSVNAVRGTLGRLVGTSRIRRCGRGLYRAGRS
ncbi:hypothetical protein [Streptomyces sp. NRRL S-37]|uniref:hypothetical protein n=1 Tax=Streptomyces sp. NRRL S-37 TaxID=1463903 RepID=UPI0004C686C6|nr:hypothetical protein [Streptomyces sp. NRRL S-37]